MKQKEGVEVLIIDALHFVEFEHGRQANETKQRRISQVMQAVAHAGELTVVAGINRPSDQFPDLASDSVFYCEQSGMKDPERGEIEQPQTTRLN